MDKRPLKRDEGLKGHDDTSAEERFYNRSIKIRKGCLAFMRDKAERGEIFEGWEHLASECGNYIKTRKYLKNAASAQVCRRWLYQFGLESSGTGYAIRSKDTVGMWIVKRE